MVAGHGISVVACFKSIGNHLKPIVSADFFERGNPFRSKSKIITACTLEQSEII